MIHLHNLHYVNEVHTELFEWNASEHSTSPLSQFTNIDQYFNLIIPIYCLPIDSRNIDN